MASTATTRLRLEKMADGENDGTWGPKMTAVLDRVDEAIAGTTSVSTTGGTTVLTSNNFTSDESRAAILLVTGTLVSNATIQIPSVSKIYVVDNATVGSFTLTIKTSGGTGAVVTQGRAQQVVCGGTNCTVVDHGPPAGAIMAWSTATVPTGWLECDGSAVSRTTYSALFAVIAETYGDGDTSTTFNLPDLRGEFIRGFDNGAGNDPDAASRTDRGDGTTGDNVGTKQDEEFLLHGHPIRAITTGVTTQGWDTTGALVRTTLGTPGNLSAFTGTPSNSAGELLGGEGGTETRPRNVAIMWIIKT
jgi:microcystin-dependent protein